MAKAKTIEERKKEIYSSMTKEELVEEMLKRDGISEQKSFQAIAKEKISDEAVKAIQKSIVKRLDDGTIVDKVLIVEEYGVKRPTKILENLVEKCCLDKQFLEEFQTGLQTYLKDHYKEICERVMYRAFLNGITKDNPILYNVINDVLEERL